MNYKAVRLEFLIFLEPEVFLYNSFPQPFRNQVFYILEDVLSPYSTYDENLWDIFEENFISILEKNGFYPSYMNAHLTSIRTTLETGLPVVRNKVSGHGQGNQVITISDEYTDYALHLAATNILFLVRLYKSKKQNS